VGIGLHLTISLDWLIWLAYFSARTCTLKSIDFQLQNSFVFIGVIIVDKKTAIITGNQPTRPPIAINRQGVPRKAGKQPGIGQHDRRAACARVVTPATSHKPPALYINVGPYGTG